jgi:hypothetical protein
MDIQFGFQLMQNVEKADTVRAPGHSDNDTVPFGNHLVTREGVLDLLESLSGGVHE